MFGFYIPEHLDTLYIHAGQLQLYACCTNQSTNVSCYFLFFFFKTNVAKKTVVPMMTVYQHYQQKYKTNRNGIQTNVIYDKRVYVGQIPADADQSHINCAYNLEMQCVIQSGSLGGSYALDVLWVEGVLK